MSTIADGAFPVAGVHDWNGRPVTDRYATGRHVGAFSTCFLQVPEVSSLQCGVSTDRPYCSGARAGPLCHFRHFNRSC